MKQGNTSLRSALFLGLIACLIYGLGAGLRASIGILLEPIADMTGLSYEEVSFSIAVMQIVFGASQPLFGLLAARWSNRFVLTSGVFFMVLSVLGIKLCTSYGMLIVTLGVLMGLGTGAIAFGLVLSSAISFVGQERSLFLRDSLTHQPVWSISFWPRSLTFLSNTAAYRRPCPDLLLLWCSSFLVSAI